jgi:isoleucyl-tRNA synthetase
MQRVIELGRAIRERQNRPLKAPLSRLVVVSADKAFLADIEGGFGEVGFALGACLLGGGF